MLITKLTLGTKKRSALNLYNQSSRKWKRRDSISSPLKRKKNIHRPDRSDYNYVVWVFFFLMYLFIYFLLITVCLLTFWVHINSIKWFHCLCVCHVAKHAHCTLLKGFLQRVTPGVNSWRRIFKSWLDWQRINMWHHLQRLTVHLLCGPDLWKKTQ